MNWFKDINHQREFDANGYVIVDFLDKECVASLKGIHDSIAPEMNGAFYTSIWSDDLNYRVEADRAIKEHFESALQENFNDYKTVFGNYILKKADQKSELGMHQDWSFTEESLCSAVNIWCPLVDTDSVNGQLSIVPKSMKLPLPSRGRGIDSPLKNIGNYVRNKHSIALTVKAGQAVIYDVRLIHGSGPNLSDKERLATSLVVVPKDADLIHYAAVSSNSQSVVKLTVDDRLFVEKGLNEDPGGVALSSSQVQIESFELTEEQFDEMYLEMSKGSF